MPVTTPFTLCFESWPTVFMYVSMAHAIVLRVGAHVGRGDVRLGADVRAERVEEAPRDALELVARDLVRVELDAALAAAERQVHERALPRHHRRERLQVVERDALVVADAALVRPEQVVVLDAVALEEPDRTVIHLHREVDDDLVLRLAQDRRDVRREVDEPRGLFEVALDDLEELVFRLGAWARTATSGRVRRGLALMVSASSRRRGKGSITRRVSWAFERGRRS